ncbi:MAG: helix-turn-helix domain-containing protein [Clostridia bacterium]|nr:helix-turn-helix domain-containing protein [Clostridia bacterium]
MSSLGEVLKQLRKKYQQTQQNVADSIGKSRESIAKYESGKAEPDSDCLATLARHFGVPIDYIITGHSSQSNLVSILPDVKKYETYLQDNDFIPYLELAVRLKDNNIDILDVEYIINLKSKYTSNKKHP